MSQAHSRQRGSKNLWLNAAYEMLVSDGIDAVKIMALAKKLNLSRTGFYWFFADLKELHAAMIERWENKNTGTLVERCKRPASNIDEGLFNLMDCWLDPSLFDARLDLAIRNWARMDDDLQRLVNEADSLRIKAIADLFERHGFPPDQAYVRSLTVVYTQIGYISVGVEEARQDRLARVQHYVEIFSGTVPSTKDVEGFLARHI
ncbi:TetR/AcrR family transcriptional regulator [Litoreibacter albidus]|uniref:TetR/AcrR family transcriptional regulator n=1 Tax=Litoreibacter albidus TaxID=670155 RepID=UPI003734C4A2